MDIVDRMFELVDRKYSEQREFAADLNVSPSMVSAWRSRKSNSYNKRLDQIASLLGCTVTYLVTGEVPEPTDHTDGLSAAELGLLGLFRRLPPDQQDMIIRMVQAAAASQ